MNANVKLFIDLQIKANKEIDDFGRTSEDTFIELEIVADTLSSEEVTEAVNEYNKLVKTDPLEQQAIDEYIEMQKHETII